MGNDNALQSFERLAHQSIKLLNEEINKIDWGKRWQENYPKTERAKEETESLKNSGVKEALKDFFSKESLILKNIGEVR